MAAILLAACSQDELAEQGTALPDGEYPLQIGSVSITAEASEEPWTRVTEKPDGSGSVFQGGERIGVRIGDNEETGVYIIKVDDAGNVTVEPDKPVYWKNTQPAEVTAWYPAEASRVSLGSQHMDGLTYVLRGTGTGNHQSPVALKFEHQLAKLRVVAKGTAEVRDISIWNVPRICYIDEGKITGLDNISTGHIQMLPVEREGIGACWEASVGPDVEIKYFNINLMDCELTSPVTTQAGALHTITITANSEGTQTINLANKDYEITGDGTYYFSGTASHAIRVTGGSPNIYLEDAEISVSSGNAIDIQGGSPTIYLDGATVSVGDGNAINITNNATPTIYVVGENNTITSSNGAGIYVAENATVTITGSNRSDVLTVTGNEGSSGIGGYVIDDRSFQSANSGNINIKNITLYAYSSSLSHLGTVSPGIGSTGSATCQSITIDNAAVYAYGCSSTSTSAPAIGNGIDYVGNTASATPTVTISNSSEVHAHRGESGGRSFADYIGRAGVYTSYSDVKASVDATSVVYKYTGDGNTPDQ